MDITHTYIYIYTTTTFAYGSSGYLAYSATHTPSPPHPSVLKDYLFYLQHQELQYVRNTHQESNEHDCMLKSVNMHNMYVTHYGDSVAHMTDPRSNI